MANLATVFAEADYSVLVINCDFRRPRLHRYLGGSDEARKVVQSDIPGVRMVNNVLSSSNSNPAEVTAAQRRVIEAARGIFDIILLDTAPLLSTNDASELVGVSDVVVLVARSGRTTKPAAARATEVLQRLEATVAGVALLGARYVPSAQYYYYATEEGRDPNRAEAESHPLDLLVRGDSLVQPGPTAGTRSATRSPPPIAGRPAADDERLEVELNGAPGAGGTASPSSGTAARPAPAPHHPRTNERLARDAGAHQRLPGAAGPDPSGRLEPLRPRAPGDAAAEPAGRPNWDLLGIVLILLALLVFGYGEWISGTPHRDGHHHRPDPDHRRRWPP